MNIVNDSIEFTNLPDNIRWVSERDLFEDMFNDSTIRLSNPALQQYYDDLMNTPIGNIVRINALIQLMNDSSTYSDSVALSSIITEMESINNNLMNTSNVIESNEYFVNKLFIQMGRYPSGEMSSSDSITLETLASSCPFDAGPSVYKARVLYALIDPSRDYNDWAICHENGLYKGGNEEQIDDNIDSGLLSRISDNAFYLYPNPASTQINIDYILANGETAELSIRDITGRIRKVVTLYSFMNQIKLDIKSLESGVYIYQYKTSSGSNRNGKLNIQ